VPHYQNRLVGDQWEYLTKMEQHFPIKPRPTWTESWVVIGYLSKEKRIAPKCWILTSPDAGLLSAVLYIRAQQHWSVDKSQKMRVSTLRKLFCAALVNLILKSLGLSSKTYIKANETQVFVVVLITYRLDICSHCVNAIKLILSIALDNVQFLIQHRIAR